MKSELVGADMTSSNFDMRVPGGTLPNTPIWGADTRRLPADAPKELVTAYQAIERACLEIERAAAVLQILRFQRGQIIKDINENNLSGVFLTLNTAMTRDLVTSISALYGKDCRSTHITEAASVLGSRLNHVHPMMMAAIATAEAKLTASLSYRVWMRRQSFRRPMVRSMMLRAL